MTLKVRSFEPEDSVDCCEILRACVPFMDGLNDAARARLLEKNTPERIADELSSYQTVVCQIDHSLVGFGALDGKEIKRVYVHPARHHRGIGRAVMAALEQIARRSGITRLSVQSSPNAVSFYERIGYEGEDGGCLIAGQARFEFIHMEKTLAKPASST